MKFKGWKITVRTNDYIGVGEFDGMAMIWINKQYNKTDEEKANLIAAAPELLDTLDELFDAVASEYGDNVCNWPGTILMMAGEKALAAIAKSKGETLDTDTE